MSFFFNFVFYRTSMPAIIAFFWLCEQSKINCRQLVYNISIKNKLTQHNVFKILLVVGQFLIRRGRVEVFQTFCRTSLPNYQEQSKLNWYYSRGWNVLSPIQRKDSNPLQHYISMTTMKIFLTYPFLNYHSLNFFFFNLFFKKQGFSWLYTFNIKKFQKAPQYLRRKFAFLLLCKINPRLVRFILPRLYVYVL